MPRPPRNGPRKILATRVIVRDVSVSRDHHEAVAAFVDYYKLLEIPPAATDREITRCFRQWNRLLHPDRNLGMPTAKAREQLLQRMSEAYDVLIRHRSEYDRRWVFVNGPKPERSINVLA